VTNPRLRSRVRSLDVPTRSARTKPNGRSLSVGRKQDGPGIEPRLSEKFIRSVTPFFCIPAHCAPPHSVGSASRVVLREPGPSTPSAFGSAAPSACDRGQHWGQVCGADGAEAAPSPTPNSCGRVRPAVVDREQRSLPSRPVPVGTHCLPRPEVHHIRGSCGGRMVRHNPTIRRSGTSRTVATAREQVARLPADGASSKASAQRAASTGSLTQLVQGWDSTMAKNGRRRRARRKKSANHGKRPNASRR
jgi:hypothetical protein